MTATPNVFKAALEDVLDGVRWWELVENTRMSEARAREILALLGPVAEDGCEIVNRECGEAWGRQGRHHCALDCRHEGRHQCLCGDYSINIRHASGKEGS